MEELELTKDASGYTIFVNGNITKRGSYKESFRHLILDKNLTKKSALELLDKTGKYYLLDTELVKKAFSETPREMPFWDVSNRLLPSYSGIPVPTDDYYTGNNVNGNPNGGTRTVQEDVNLLMNASQTGDQNIFDASVLGVLGDNNDEKLKEIIPVLTEATHLVGTLLYSLWWNLDEYKEEFTTDELYEMEQSLLDVFKKLGDITLKFTLRKKLYTDD
jgi:hypothetical protein